MPYSTFIGGTGLGPSQPVKSSSAAPVIFPVFGTRIRTLPASARNRSSVAPLTKDMFSKWTTEERLGANDMYNRSRSHGLMTTYQDSDIQGLRRVAESIPSMAPVSTSFVPFGMSSLIGNGAYVSCFDRAFLPASKQPRPLSERPENQLALIHEATHSNNIPASLPLKLLLSSRSGSAKNMDDEFSAMVEQGVATAVAGKPYEGTKTFGQDDEWIEQQAKRFGFRPGSGDFMRLYAKSPETRQWAQMTARKAYEAMQQSKKE